VRVWQSGDTRLCIAWLSYTIIRSGIRNVFHDAGTLTVAQHVHKLPALYGTRMFLTTFPTSVHTLLAVLLYAWRYHSRRIGGAVPRLLPRICPILCAWFAFFQLHSVPLIKLFELTSSFYLVCYFPEEDTSSAGKCAPNKYACRINKNMAVSITLIAIWAPKNSRFRTCPL